MAFHSRLQPTISTSQPASDALFISSHLISHRRTINRRLNSFAAQSRRVRSTTPNLPILTKPSGLGTRSFREPRLGYYCTRLLCRLLCFLTPFQARPDSARSAPTRLVRFPALSTTTTLRPFPFPTSVLPTTPPPSTLPSSPPCHQHQPQNQHQYQPSSTPSEPPYPNPL